MMKKILKKLVSAYGETILLDNDRLRGLLKDYRIEERKVIQLNTLLQISLFKDIIRRNCGNPQIRRIVRQCQSKTMFPEPDIEDIVNAILYALDRAPYPPGGEEAPPVPKDYTKLYRAVTVFSFSIVCIAVANTVAAFLGVYTTGIGTAFTLSASVLLAVHDLLYYARTKKLHQSCREILLARIDAQLLYTALIFIALSYCRITVR